MTTETDSASTRDRLLDVAARRFAELGFRQTSVSAVARELEISPSAVYFHFANKEELFIAAFDREVSLLGDFTVGDGPESLGDGYWKSVMAQIVSVLPRFPLVSRVLRGQEPDLMGRATTGEMARRLRDTISQSLLDGQEAGTVRTDIDVESTATALQAIMLSVLITTIQSGGRLLSDADAMRTFFVSALEPR